MAPCVPLHVHSHGSFHFSTLTVEEIIAFARANALPAIALTDHNLVYALPFISACHAAGVKPIVGLCLKCRLILFARDDGGMQSLNTIATHHALHPKAPLPEVIGKPSGCLALLHDPSLLPLLLSRMPREAIALEIRPVSPDNAHLSTLAQRHALPLIPTAPARRLHPGADAWRTLRLLQAVGANTTLDALPPTTEAERWAFLFTPRRMERFFPKQLVKATHTWASRIALPPPDGGLHFPRAPGVHGGEAPSLLRRRCLEALPRRYPKKEARIKARKRVDDETAVITRMHFDDLFLLMGDLVRYAKRRGIPVLGRGSAAASIVSYLLGITPVDPIALDLAFERFLNPERTSPPDIDLDVGTSRREELIAFLYNAYGAEKVAMISTHITFGPKGAFRETAKALGYGEGEIARLYRRRAEPIAALSRGLLGLARGWGIHCGGVVIAPEPLTRTLALTHAPGGRLITQPDMGPVEQAGLLKVDILGNRSLDVLSDTLERIRKRGAKPSNLDLATLLKDEGTLALLREGRTMGCFYVESPAMRQLLAKLRIESFEDLVAASSIIRPGVARSGMMAAYIERRNNPEAAAPLHPILAPLLHRTFGIMVYQEDVIRVLHEVVGMSPGEADLFRRAMSGKERSSKAMERLTAPFFRRARARGLDPALARDLYRQIASFAGYAFCKSHSASFATLSITMAALKAHHPAEFLAAVLSNGGGFYPPRAYISEARRLGLTLLPPNVNEAEVNYTGAGDTLRVGLAAVKHLGRDLAERVVEERRRNGPYTSVGNFLRRVKASREATATLIDAGGFASLGYTPAQLQWGLASAFTAPDTPLPLLPPEPPARLVEREIAALSYALTAHPLALLPRPPGFIRSDRLGEHVNEIVRTAGIIVTLKRLRTRKEGRVMAFLDMEDETAPFAATLFPDLYARSRDLIRTPEPLLLTGRVVEEFGVISLMLTKMERVPFRWRSDQRKARAGRRGSGGERRIALSEDRHSREQAGLKTTRGWGLQRG